MEKLALWARKHAALPAIGPLAVAQPIVFHWQHPAKVQQQTRAPRKKRERPEPSCWEHAIAHMDGRYGAAYFFRVSAGLRVRIETIEGDHFSRDFAGIAVELLDQGRAYARSQIDMVSVPSVDDLADFMAEFQRRRLTKESE